MSSDPTTTNAAGNPLPPLPADHLSHPEQWATGAEPATQKQKGFIKVLENQHPDAVPSEGLDLENLGKSEASEVIEKLKNGQSVNAVGKNDPAEKAEVQEKVREKRKAPAPSTSLSASEKKEEEVLDSFNKTAADDQSGKTKEDAIEVDSADDEKEAGQTTLDNAFKPSTNGTKKDEPTSAGENGASAAEADEDGPSESKKARRATPDVTTATDNATTTSNSDDKSAPAAETETAQTADDTVPGDDEHLDHPENWTTGDEPATEKQKGYIKVLEKQKGAAGSVGDVEQLGKSEASEKIDELRSA